MRHEYPLPPLSAQQYAALMEAAKVRAIALRREAIDDFWRGADAAFQRGLTSGAALVARSALRLQARLARHRLNRRAGVQEV